MSVAIALKLQTTFILLSHKSTSFTEMGGGQGDLLPTPPSRLFWYFPSTNTRRNRGLGRVKPECPSSIDEVGIFLSDTH